MTTTWKITAVSGNETASTGSLTVDVDFSDGSKYHGAIGLPATRAQISAHFDEMARNKDASNAPVSSLIGHDSSKAAGEAARRQKAIDAIDTAVKVAKLNLASQAKAAHDKIDADLATTQSKLDSDAQAARAAIAAS